MMFVNFLTLRSNTSLTRDTVSVRDTFTFNNYFETFSYKVTYITTFNFIGLVILSFLAYLLRQRSDTL